MTAANLETIPARVLVWNGPALRAARDGKGMSRGKMTGQAVQVTARSASALRGMWVTGIEHMSLLERRMDEWSKWTTTITRLATTEAVWERVCDECEGQVMVDEGYTEVEPGTPTCLLTWPLLRDEMPRILSNAKVPLLGDDDDAMLRAFLAGNDAGIFAGGSDQEREEFRIKTFREWRREDGR